MSGFVFPDIHVIRSGSHGILRHPPTRRQLWVYDHPDQFTRTQNVRKVNLEKHETWSHGFLRCIVPGSDVRTHFTKQSKHVEEDAAVKIHCIR